MAPHTAIESRPGDFRGWFGLGQMYDLLDMHQLALEYYCRASRLASDHRIFTAIGDCYLIRGQGEHALRAFERALEAPFAPSSVHLKVGLAHSRCISRDSRGGGEASDSHRLAIQHYRTYLEKNPALLAADRPIDDQIVREAILTVAKDDEANGDHMKATIWLSILSRSHGLVRQGLYHYALVLISTFLRAEAFIARLLTSKAHRSHWRRVESYSGWCRPYHRAIIRMAGRIRTASLLFSSITACCCC